MSTNYIGKKIRELRQEKGFTQERLAESINLIWGAGVNRGMISKWESGKDRPSLENVKRLAGIFRVPMDTLVDSTAHIDQEPLPSASNFHNVLPITTKKVPLLGEIACGEPIYADEDRESYVDVGTNIKCDFALKAKGDSMIGARINDGDIVFIRKQQTVNNGEIAAVVVGDEATLKRVEYIKESNILLLKAENPAFETVAITDETLDTVHILGKAIAFQSDVI